MKVEAAASIADCSVQTIYRLCESGLLPAANISVSKARRDWRIEKDALIEWLRQGGNK